jgi:hypothetical protein
MTFSEPSRFAIRTTLQKNTGRMYGASQIPTYTIRRNSGTFLAYVDAFAAVLPATGFSGTAGGWPIKFELVSTLSEFGLAP